MNHQTLSPSPSLEYNVIDLKASTNAIGAFEPQNYHPTSKKLNTVVLTGRKNHLPAMQSLIAMNRGCLEQMSNGTLGMESYSQLRVEKMKPQNLSD